MGRRYRAYIRWYFIYTQVPKLTGQEVYPYLSTLHRVFGHTVLRIVIEARITRFSQKIERPLSGCFHMVNAYLTVLP